MLVIYMYMKALALIKRKIIVGVVVGKLLLLYIFSTLGFVCNGKFGRQYMSNN